MTTKIEYRSTHTCDYCGKEVKTDYGDYKPQGTTFGFTQYWDFGSGDMCSDCTESFKQWKQSRKKE